jgi:filamentous hemagglutinin
MLSNNLLKKQGVDAHALKMDFLGKRAKIARYDLYKHTDTGEILIFKKGGGGEPIFTGEFIK